MLKRDSANLIVEKTGATAAIAINRARQRNTLSIETLNQLITEFQQLGEDREVAVIILRGLGEAFAAGADINELLALNAISAVDFSQLGGRLFNLMRQLPQLIIAAIDGFCMGGGLDLALACDLRYATPTAIFAHPGANIGIITGFGGTRRLPNAVGAASAAELFATADRIDGQRAYQLGLIQALAVDLTAYELAQSRAAIISRNGRVLIRRIKTLIRLASEIDNPQRELLVKRYCEFERLALTKAN